MDPMGHVKFLDNIEMTARFRDALALGKPMEEDSIESYVITLVSSGIPRTQMIPTLIEVIKKSYDPKNVIVIEWDSASPSGIFEKVKGQPVVILVDRINGCNFLRERGGFRKADFRFMVRNAMKQYSGRTGRIYVIFAATRTFSLYDESNVVVYADKVGREDNVPTDMNTFPKKFLDSVRKRVITKVSDGKETDPYTFVQVRRGCGLNDMDSGYIDLSYNEGRCETCAKLGKGCSGVKGGLVGPWKQNPCYVTKE